MADAAKQWDLEHDGSQDDEALLRRRAKQRARYYSVKCSTYSLGTRLSQTTAPHANNAPAEEAPSSPRLPTTTWQRIRDAIGVVKGLPADAIEDTERLYDD